MTETEPVAQRPQNEVAPAKKTPHGAALVLSIAALLLSVLSTITFGLRSGVRDTVDRPTANVGEGRLISTKEGDTFVFFNTPLEVVVADYNRYGETPRLVIDGATPRAIKVFGFYPPTRVEPLLTYLLHTENIYSVGGHIGSVRDLPPGTVRATVTPH